MNVSTPKKSRFHSLEPVFTARHAQIWRAVSWMNISFRDIHNIVQIQIFFSRIYIPVELPSFGMEARSDFAQLTWKLVLHGCDAFQVWSFTSSLASSSCTWDNSSLQSSSRDSSVGSLYTPNLGIRLSLKTYSRSNRSSTRFSSWYALESLESTGVAIRASDQLGNHHMGGVCNLFWQKVSESS